VGLGILTLKNKKYICFMYFVNKMNLILIHIIVSIILGDTDVYINSDEGKDEGSCLFTAPCKTFNYTIGIAETHVIEGKNESINIFLLQDINLEIIKRPATDYRYYINGYGGSKNVFVENSSSYIVVNQVLSFSEINFVLPESIGLFMIFEI
jgi:hypothetical protein